MFCSSPPIMPSELVYQHQQQIPINGTISGMAPPGNETGYYYIPVANLPWQTSWQELKDHVRSVCSVEHVEINEDSTSGHVVLQGRANFDAAFRLLNGGVFNDRALIADGRNVDNWVLVKQHVNGPTSSLPRYSTIPAQQTPFLTAQSPPSYGEWLFTSAGPAYIISPIMDSPPYFAAYTMPEYSESAALYNLNSALPYPSGLYTQQHPQQEYYGNNYVVSHNNMATAEGRQYCIDTVPTKKRKIIIRQIQPWATESHIRELIRHKAESESESLLKLDMPLASGQQGGNRGYVIATFGSEGAAEKAVKQLNNYKYDGRVLEVKHTKESIPDHQPSLGSRSNQQRHSHHSHQSHRERHDEKIRKGKAKENSHSVTDSGEKIGLSTPSSSSESSVVIAHGSSVSYA